MFSKAVRITHFSKNFLKCNHFCLKSPNADDRKILLKLVETNDYKTDKISRFLEKYSFNRWNFSADAFKSVINNIKKKREIRSQEFNPSRAEQLGFDLSAAYVVISVGGAVKFKGKKEILTVKKSDYFPVLKDPSYKLEAVDLQNIKFHYAALENFRQLNFLKWINLSGNLFVNGWYLDYLADVAPNIEFLDISRCVNVDHNALYGLYKFKKLRLLNVENISNSLIFRLVCLTMESEIPDLVIVGHITKPEPKTAFNNTIPQN